MKNNKKIFAMILSLVMLFSMSLSVFAASGINQNEQTILNALTSRTVEHNGKQVSLPAEYVNQARNYMMTDGVDLGADECAQVVASINEAWAIIESADLSGITSFDDIPADLMNSVLGKVQAAADILGITVSIDGSGKPSITLVAGSTTEKETDKTTGTTSTTGSKKTTVTKGSTASAIKQTGFSFTSTVAVLAILTLAAGVCVVYVKKNQLGAE